MGELRDGVFAGNDYEPSVRGNVYTDKWRGVCVFIAMRESCENSELGKRYLRWLAKLSSCPIRAKNEAMEKRADTRGRVTFQISDISWKDSRD